MTQAICSEEGCTERAFARGWCSRHYGARYRAGRIEGIEEARAAFHRLSDLDREARTATCSQCGPVSVRLRGGHRGAECMVKRARDRKAGPRRPGKSNPAARRRWKYGLTAEDFAKLHEAAGGRCPICDVELGEDYHIDHCHETGLVRGLLCKRCNLALGWFDDSPPRVLAAYMYLKANGKDDSDWAHRAS